MNRKEAHLFAIYYPGSSQCAARDAIFDKKLIHRIKKVLRLRDGEQCIFFDRMVNLHIELTSITDRSIIIKVVAREKNTILLPSIVLLLPLLKKDALEQAVYSAIEMGATSLQLLITSKSRQRLTETELDRLKKIIIAAAEQSKQFVFPEISEPVALNNKLLNSLDGSSRLFADPEGKPVLDLLSDMQKKEDLLLMVGPEGDLTPLEKELLVKGGFLFCALTPTIVRSFQAASLLVGVCRTYFS